MGDIKSLDQLSLLLGYIVPGLIIIFTRAQFLTGRIAAPKDSILSYFAVSAVYLGLVQAITSIVTGTRAPLFQQTPYWLPVLLGGAIVFGLLLGLNAGFGVTRSLVGRIGINVPHAIDSAWDYRFHDLPECMVRIILKDGTQYYGYWGPGSFAGSDPADRDLFLAQVYELTAPDTWDLKDEGKGLYIAGGEIRSIEFSPIAS